MANTAPATQVRKSLQILLDDATQKREQRLIDIYSCSITRLDEGRGKDGKSSSKPPEQA